MFLNTDFLQNNKVGLQYLQNHSFKSMRIVFIGSILIRKIFSSWIRTHKNLRISFFLSRALGQLPLKFEPFQHNVRN